MRIGRIEWRCRSSVPGNEQHSQLRPDCHETLRQRGPVHVRHDNVGQQQVDLTGVLLEQLSRLKGCRRLEDMVTLTPEHGRDDEAN